MTDMTKQEAEEAAAIERKHHMDLGRRIHAARVKIMREHGNLFAALRSAKPEDEDNGR
jgi:hypothetical protein